MDYTYINKLNVAKGHIIKKLYAVIAMTLIASILLTTVSFAWLTLTIAPEVVGIDTTVGSNGNLEIALNTNDLGVSSLIGKEDQPIGLADAYDRNPYWGNIIDLSDERYGLQQIELKPATLNIKTEDPQIIDNDSPIKFAKYTLDGRVQMIDDSSAAATYDSEAGQFVGISNYGVRAAGIQGMMETSVSDVYAFSVDLLFRTNAVGANLLLQTLAVDRIYNEGNAPENWEYYDEWAEVQGSGSNITMENKKLQEAIRVAFVDTLTGEVYGIAAPNEDGDLYLMEDPESAEIKPLIQNEVTAISVWIYLDGSLVENLHADTTAATEMTVNLQFATDVKLDAAYGDDTTPPTPPAESTEYYLGYEGDGNYTIYTLNADGSRDYTMPFNGTVNEENHTVIVDSVSEYPERGIWIPALVTGEEDQAQYVVSIDPSAPFENLSADSVHIAFVPVDGSKVSVAGTSLMDLFDANDRSVYCTIDMRGLNTSNVTLMDRMFEGCSGLTELDVSGFNTSNVTDMRWMFQNCSSLTELDLSSFDMSKVTSADYMISGCSNLATIVTPMGVGEVSITLPGSYLCESNSNTYTVIDKTVPAQATLKKSTNDSANDTTITIVDTGDVTDSIAWTLYSNGLLKLSGTGDIPNWSSNESRPWESYLNDIVEVELEDGITNIGNYAFSECSNLASISIPNSVTYIGHDAFYLCYSLISVDIPEGVRSIGREAFYVCSSLTTINIPKSVTSIGDYALAFCYDLTSITIPESVTQIGGLAFRSCTSLTTINIPKSVTQIGYGVFIDCTNLESITVAANNPAYTSIDGNLYTKNGDMLIQYAIAKAETSFEIPNSVTQIGDDAFFKSNLTSIVIPDSVISIGYSAFQSCSITSIDIPKSVTSIGDAAFSGCNGLTSITIPDSVTSIGVSVFGFCENLERVTIPHSVLSIGQCAFQYCRKLTSVTYTGTVQQWEIIEKVSDWDKNTGAYTIHCTDGDIAKS